MKYALIITSFVAVEKELNSFVDVKVILNFLALKKAQPCIVYRPAPKCAIRDEFIEQNQHQSIRKDTIFNAQLT